MSDDHARAAEIDRLTSALGWTKGLLAQAVRDRKAAQQMVNIVTAERDEARVQAARLPGTIRRLHEENKLLRAVAEAAEEMPHGCMHPFEKGCRMCEALDAWRAHAPKP